MNKAVYDTHFFMEFYNSKDPSLLEKIRKEKYRHENYVSTLVIHELYKLSLANHKTQVIFLKQEFKIMPVDNKVAEISAVLANTSSKRETA